MQTQTINISLPAPLVKRIDQLARKEYASRSDLIRQALLEKIEKKEAWEEIFKAGRRAAKKLGIKNEDDVNRIIAEYRHEKRKN